MFCISAESMRVHTHIWNSESCWIFCKLEMQVISMERRGKENPYHYFCYSYPKELGVFKAIFLLIFPSNLQYNNLLRCKYFFFVFLLVFRLMDKLSFLSYALGLEICTKGFQNCLVKFWWSECCFLPVISKKRDCNLEVSGSAYSVLRVI